MIIHVVHWEKSGIYKVVESLLEQAVADSDQHCCFTLRSGKTKLDALKQFLIISRVVVNALIKRNATFHAHSFLPIMLMIFCRAGSVSVTLHNDYPFFQEKCLRSYFKRWLMKSILKWKKARVSAVSEAVKNSSVSWVGVDVVTILNPVDMTKFTSLSSPKQIKDFCTAGRFDEQKNYSALIDGFGGLSSGKFLTLSIAGSGELQQELQAQAIKYPDSKIVFPGYVADMSEFYKNFDVFICTSHYEGGPLVVVEAMLSNRVIVSTDVGILFQSNDFNYISVNKTSESISEGIQAALSMKEEDINIMVNSNRKACIELFSPNEIFNKYKAHIWKETEFEEAVS